MLNSVERTPLIVRLTAPFAWRSERRIAMKLLGFGATEEGSAHDMMRAAELTEDPRLKRLFFRHSVDEARHAAAFRAAAAKLGGGSTRAGEALRARREDLYERLGLVRFLAFVHHSESQAKRQFESLAAHFADTPELAHLFEHIVKDEHQHATYSGQLLVELEEAGRGQEVTRARRWVRWWLRWGAWRRAGRDLGERFIRLFLATLWLVALPFFVVPARLSRDAAPGWHALPAPDDTPARIRRPF